MDGLSVREQNDPKVPLLLRNVYPPADPTIPLDGFRDGLPDRQNDPFVTDMAPVRARPSVSEVLCGLEDTQTP